MKNDNIYNQNYCNILKEQFNEKKKYLTEREQIILTYMYGLNETSPKTREETIKYFNLTESRLKQIENKIRKCRKYDFDRLKQMLDE